MRVEIIILKYKNPAMEDACVSSVLEHTHCPYDLTVYDNAPENMNIGVLWNKLINRSWADYICLLNSDTLVEEGWLTKLMEVFDEHEDAGAVGPVTNSSNNPQERDKTKEKEVHCLSDEESMGALCGFCLLFKKKAWEDTNGFDEHFGFYGQENAFLCTFKKAGYRQYYRTDVFVYHHGGGSIKLAERRGEIDQKKELELGRKKRNAYLEKIRRNEV
jgi:hypothetical protein